MYVAACDGAEPGWRDHQEQLQDAGRRVSPSAAHHCVSAAQQLQTETESQAGVETLQEPQVRGQVQTQLWTQHAAQSQLFFSFVRWRPTKVTGIQFSN